MKKTWFKIKRGLLTPEHRNKMGIRIWLYMYIVDRADWDTGTVYEWRDKDEADDLGMPWRTLQQHRQQLEEDGYISCIQKGQYQNITIHNWTNPREYSGVIHNIIDIGYEESRTPKTEGTNEGTMEGTNSLYIEPSTLPLTSHITNHRPQKEDTAAAVSSFHDHLTPVLTTIYANITGQTAIPFQHTAQVFSDLEAIYAAYGDDADRVVEDGKKMFAKWCSTRAKNGRYYSRTNPAWLGKWLEELAPSPAKAEAVEIPRPHAMCAQGEQLQKRVEQYPDSYLSNYKDHIDGCHICGGASNVGDVQDHIKQLAQRMSVK